MMPIRPALMQGKALGSDYLPGVFKWLAAMVASVWVTVPAAVQVLIVLMVIDYFTGIINAVIMRQLNSTEGFKGLARKTLTLVLVSTAWYVARSMNLGINLGSTVAVAFSVNELISITENCAKAGVPIPETLLIVVVRAKRLAGRTKSAAEVEKELETGVKP